MSKAIHCRVAAEILMEEKIGRWAAQLFYLQFGKFAPDFFQPILSAVIFCLGCIAGFRLSPIQFVGAMEEVYLLMQGRNSLFPLGFGVHR
ncbi:MAG: hypothetical protein ACLPVW_12125 [Terriglobales bacterium]